MHHPLLPAVHNPIHGAEFLDCDPETYHSISGLSSTAAKAIIARSPAHARIADKEPTALMDRGQVMHTLLLSRGKRIEIVDAENWRTKAAREQRDKIREDGAVPMLKHLFEAANDAANAIRKKLTERGIILDGESEVAIGWTEDTAAGPARCRMMADHISMSARRAQIWDLKIVDDASPLAVERSAENMGYAIQAAAYPRGLESLFPQWMGRVEFGFIFAEPEPPYAINVSEPDGIFRAIGLRRWLRAANAWARCHRDNNWPDYGGPNTITVPRYAQLREGYEE